MKSFNLSLEVFSQFNSKIFQTENENLQSQIYNHIPEIISETRDIIRWIILFLLNPLYILTLIVSLVT